MTDIIERLAREAWQEAGEQPSDEELIRVTAAACARIADDGGMCGVGAEIRRRFGVE